MFEKILTESEKHSHVKCSLQILHLISGVSFNNEIVSVSVVGVAFFKQTLLDRSQSVSNSGRFI